MYMHSICPLSFHLADRRRCPGGTFFFFSKKKRSAVVKKEHSKDERRLVLNFSKVYFPPPSIRLAQATFGPEMWCLSIPLSTKGCAISRTKTA